MLKKYQLKGWYKTEKEFQRDYLKALRDDWYLTYRRQDVWLSYKFLDSECWDKQWNCTQIEFKKIPGDTFNVWKFEHSQVLILKDLDDRKLWIAYVIIWSIKRNDYKILTFTEIWGWKNKVGGYKVFKD